MSNSIHAVRLKIIETGRLLFERRLTDAIGGNVSIREDQFICMTPRHSGSKFYWNLRPEQILVFDLQGSLLEGDGEVSREADAHFALYRAFPEAKGIIHAHPYNVLVFAAALKPIPPVLESSQRYGEIGLAKYAESNTPEMGEYLVEALAGQEERVRSEAAAVLLPWHGMFAVGKDLDAAYEAVEQTDTNARCILLGKLLTGQSG